MRECAYKSLIFFDKFHSPWTAECVSPIENTMQIRGLLCPDEQFFHPFMLHFYNAATNLSLDRFGCHSLNWPMGTNS